MKETLKRPNIILVLTDDQGYWAMGCAGNEEIRTPNLDRLACEGIRFENMFCVSPVCSAARASILTGNIPSCHGIHDFLLWGREHDYLAGKPGYTEFLAESGYRCGISGKWHMGMPDTKQKGYGYWRVHTEGYIDGVTHFGDGRTEDEGAYSTCKITEDALSFIRSGIGEDSPYYLTVAYNAPHSPWRPEDHPAASFEEYFRNCPFESVPDLPKSRYDAGVTDFFSSPERRREKLSGYYAAMTEMDAGLGKILDLLEELGQSEDTLVIFTSDNGMNMGHHGICGKGNGTRPLNMFDTSVRVPGIVWRPGHVPEGLVARQLYSHYDFMPTVLEYAGVPNPVAEERPGRSFAGLLKGLPEKNRDFAVVYDEYGYTRMIRTEKWKYVHRHGADYPCELYDLEDDPGELRNLAGTGGYSGQALLLKGKLEQWFANYVLDELDGTKLPVTGSGQMRPARHSDAFAQDWPEEWKHKKQGDET